MIVNLVHCMYTAGVETRTSAPVQITRDKETLQCAAAAGLYPTGK
jgi:hypothetical protein